MNIGLDARDIFVTLREEGQEVPSVGGVMVEQPPMAQMLARMERDGLIERTRDPADGRSSRIVLTRAAQERMPEAITTLFQENREAMAGFTPAEAALLVALLKRLIGNLDQIASAENPSRGS
ncbi:MarR family winged helix-turn-helix transcriptional regulator [Mesorhizobium sp. A623]